MSLQALALAASLSLAPGHPVGADPAGILSGALWTVVRLCTLDSRLTGSPWPCLALDRRRGFTLIADPKRRTQFLLAPTARVVGIESPALLAPGAPNFWWLAWSSRAWLSLRAKHMVAAEDVGLAVNSAPGRTQDQLHIHIDCLRTSTRRAINADLDAVGDEWAELTTPLVRGHRYRARWLTNDALQVTNPFRLLASDPAVESVAAWTLVMVAAHRPSGEHGFVLLSHKAALAADDLAAGEELLDHGCSVLKAERGGTPRLPRSRNRSLGDHEP